jgi:hypothetical protein
MEPTFNQLDVLELEAYGKEPIRAGDVILFTPPGDSQPVIHRVSRLRGATTFTRGDDSQVEDPWILRPPDIRARVVAAHRGSRRRIIRGGIMGLAVARAGRAKRRLLHFGAVIAKAAGGERPMRRLISILIPVRLRPRVVEIRCRGARQLHLAAGRQVIGRYDRRRERWQVNRLGRVLVEPGTLPTPDQLEK